jgi:hypothetical protein
MKHTHNTSVRALPGVSITTWVSNLIGKGCGVILGALLMIASCGFAQDASPITKEFDETSLQEQMASITNRLADLRTKTEKAKALNDDREADKELEALASLGIEISDVEITKILADTAQAVQGRRAKIADLRAKAADPKLSSSKRDAYLKLANEREARIGKIEVLSGEIKAVKSRIKTWSALVEEDREFMRELIRDEFDAQWSASLERLLGELKSLADSFDAKARNLTAEPPKATQPKPAITQ